ncbi:MAG: hypothetical protein ACXAEL_15395, partial [Candidatus Hodarchaeales archaeon]
LGKIARIRWLGFERHILGLLSVIEILAKLGHSYRFSINREKFVVGARTCPSLSGFEVTVSTRDLEF